MKETYKQADAQFLGKPGTRRKKGPKFISHFILFAILMFSIVILVWAHYAIIDEFIVGEGKVIPSRQVQMIANLEGGIVEQILVKEGMVVEKGQPLLIIDDTRYVASYKENLVKETSLEIKYLRLKAEAEKKEYSIPEKLKEADPGGAAFEMSLFKSRQEEYKELQQSYQFAQKEYEMTVPLIKKGAASKVEVLRLQRAIAELRGKVISFDSQTLDELSKVKAELSSVREANAANFDRIKRSTVRSPVKGIIKQMNVYTEGGIVQPGSDLAEIVPLDDTLLVEARVKPKDIGFLHLGQHANVMITAFDFARYGSLHGVVEQISADSITDEKTQDVFYLIRVRTQKNYLGTEKNPLYIIPGMQTTVNIETGQKSILDYILNPIINTLNKALRER